MPGFFLYKSISIKAVFTKAKTVNYERARNDGLYLLVPPESIRPSLSRDSCIVEMSILGLSVCVSVCLS